MIELADLLYFLFYLFIYFIYFYLFLIQFIVCWGTPHVRHYMKYTQVRTRFKSNMDLFSA